jgi:hypothetical protein
MLGQYGIGQRAGALLLGPHKTQSIATALSLGVCAFRTVWDSSITRDSPLYCYDSALCIWTLSRVKRRTFTCPASFGCHHGLN